jgi:hypothetical protein
MSRIADIQIGVSLLIALMGWDHYESLPLDVRARMAADTIALAQMEDIDLQTAAEAIVFGC